MNEKHIFFVVGVVGIILGVIILGVGISHLLTSYTLPSTNSIQSIETPTLPNSTTRTILLNTNAGILTINLTFSNLSWDNASQYVVYQNYNITSATIELANGTTITPANNYVQKEISINNYDAFASLTYYKTYTNPKFVIWEINFR